MTRDSDGQRPGPILIELDDEAPRVSPSEAPPILDAEIEAPSGQAMQTMAALATRRPSALTRWFWRLLAGVVVFFSSVAAWDFVVRMIERNQILGYGAVALLGLFLVVAFAVLVREWAALARLARIDSLHRQVSSVLAENDLTGAQAVVDRLEKLYAARPELSWARERMDSHRSDAVDADALLDTVERDLMASLDAAARREVETASRQVATVTALVPLAFADVISALTANLRMIRRIAEIYGGRSGALGGWRLTRSVMTHLVATGAVAVGDDLIGSVAGGGVLSRVSRRFGEGVINGALTARVGLAAMEVCRPLPFRALPRPSVTQIVRRAMTGLFTTRTETGAR